VALGGGFELGWIADGEGDADAEVVAVGEAAGHLPAVVARHDDEGVLEFVALSEKGEEFGAFVVEALDFAGVGVEFEADGRGVGKMGGEGKLGGLGVGGRGPGDVRIVAAEPEAEGLFCGFGFEECGERGVGWAGGIAGWFARAGAPAFAGVADVIAGLGEELGVGRLAGREGAVEAGGGAEGVGPLAGEQAGAGGGAAGVRGEGVVEESALGGDTIEGGGGHSAAVGGGVGVGPVIGQEEENIGPGGSEGGDEKLTARKWHMRLR